MCIHEITKLIYSGWKKSSSGIYGVGVQATYMGGATGIGVYPGTCPNSCLEKVMEYFLIKLADDSKLGTWVDALKGRAVVQRNLYRLEEWANESIMKLIKEKMQSLVLGRENPPVVFQVGDWLAGGHLCWKGPGDLARQRAKHELAVCPGSKDDQQHPRLH